VAALCYTHHPIAAVAGARITGTTSRNFFELMPDNLEARLTMVVRWRAAPRCTDNPSYLPQVGIERDKMASMESPRGPGPTGISGTVTLGVRSNPPSYLVHPGLQEL